MIIYLFRLIFLCILQVAHLAAVGGKNTVDCVRRGMAGIISNELAQQFSLRGKRGKRAFGTLLLDGVLKSKFSPHTLRPDPN